MIDEHIDSLFMSDDLGSVIDVALSGSEQDLNVHGSRESRVVLNVQIHTNDGYTAHVHDIPGCLLSLRSHVKHAFNVEIASSDALFILNSFPNIEHIRIMMNDVTLLACDIAHAEFSLTEIEIGVWSLVVMSQRH